VEWQRSERSSTANSRQNLEESTQNITADNISGQIVKSEQGNASPSLSLSHPSPFLFPYPFLSLPFPSPPLRSRPPKIQLGSLGSAVSSPSGVWGRAPAEIEFGVFYP